MSDKYQNKYRISSARLQSWNYGLQASYFVTVCTAQRKHFFGKIIDGEMILSDIGKIAENEWINTPLIRPDMNLELDAFCVMPNHFHAIIIIGENQYNNRRYGRNGCDGCGGCGGGCGGRDAMHRVSTGATGATVVTANKFGAQSKNLASIMRGFKSAVTTRSRIMNRDFGWQTRFHDHIIRSDAEFVRIRNYIVSNPANWVNDKLYKSE